MLENQGGGPSGQSSSGSGNSKHQQWLQQQQHLQHHHHHHHHHADVISCWYHGLTSFYHHQLAMTMAAAAAAVEARPSAAKRRKLEVSASSSTSSDRLLSRRGPVTFRPYSDNLSANSEGDLDQRQRISDCDDGSRPQKRKHGTAGLAVGSSGCCSRDRANGRGMQNQSRKGERRTEVDEGATVKSLFPEILEVIFKHLDVQSRGRAARVRKTRETPLRHKCVTNEFIFQVCSRWRDAVYRKSVWKGVEAKLHIGKQNMYLYPSLVRRGIKKVQVLSLRKSLRELINGIPNLESLNLSGCYNLSDSALDGAINRDLPDLKELNLSLCKEVSDNSLGRIATHCKGLQSLDLGGCTKITNTGLLLISWGLKKLEMLNLRSCRLISDHGIGYLAGLDSTGSNYASSSGLKELGLQDCQKLTDESLKHVSVGIPELRKINLSFCISVTDTGLKSLAKLSSLEDLNLRSCDNVSDIGIGFLSSEDGCSGHLRALDVSFCGNITNAGIKSIACGLRGLRSLSMANCIVTDDGLEKISTNLAGLKSLNLGQCNGVSDRSLGLMCDRLKELSRIDLYGCCKASEATISRIRRMPKMTDLNLSLHMTSAS